jgi:hypothetical protein
MSFDVARVVFLSFTCLATACSSTPQKTGPVDSGHGGSDSGDGGQRQDSGDATTDVTSGGCTDPSSCPAVPAGPCASLGMATCESHKCGVAYMAGDAPSQEYGSCTKNVCDAKGAMTSIEDDTNVFDDGNPCSPYVCTAGVPTHKPLLPGATCLMPGMVMGACEFDPDPTTDVLVCSACDPKIATSCSATPGDVCSEGTCVPISCTDGLKDDGETDIDCGGTACLPCGSLKACVKPTDCFSEVCTASVCQAPTCMDGLQNSQETGIDCGGPVCPPCSAGNDCAAPRDCASAVCKSPETGEPDVCQTPSCTDGVQNGDETGVDCGGSGDGGIACPPCAK